MQDLQSVPQPAPGLSTAHICTVTTYGGGSFAELRPPERAGRIGGGGPRGHVTEFSRASRRRLMKLLASIDKEAVEIPLFLTLTYPAAYPEDAPTVASHLRAFRERLVRRYGKRPGIWRKEYQRRGAPHLHVMIWVDADLAELRRWVSRAWYEVVGSGDERHLRAGTQVQQVKSWRGVRGYAAKYMGKIETLRAGAPSGCVRMSGSAGRQWGVWYRALLPITAHEYYLNLRSFFRLRRCFRRLSGKRPTHRLTATSCFLEHSATLRWLRYESIRT